MGDRVVGTDRAFLTSGGVGRQEDDQEVAEVASEVAPSVAGAEGEVDAIGVGQDRAEVGRRDRAAIVDEAAAQVQPRPARREVQSAPPRSVTVLRPFGTMARSGAVWKSMGMRSKALHSTMFASKVRARLPRGRPITPTVMMSGSVSEAVPPWSGSTGAKSGFVGLKFARPLKSSLTRLR